VGDLARYLFLGLPPCRQFLDLPGPSTQRIARPITQPTAAAINTAVNGRSLSRTSRNQ
jgi:hypothetical protein